MLVVKQRGTSAERVSPVAVGGLDLAVRHRLNACSDNFSEIGRFEDHERGERGTVFWKRLADQRWNDEPKPENHHD
jgi:hypothetical protein